MPSHKVVFWEVDTQADFMLPGGALYVPGAERLLPNLRRLTHAASQDKVFLVSHGCYHSPNDPEFKIFPPHCIKGTPGSAFVTEALAEKVIRVPNEPTASLPENLSDCQQILLEKQTLDIFQSLHADELVKRFAADTEFIVFGVVTEYCVGFAAKGLLERGHRVSVISDAIETLRAEDSDRALREMQTQGAKFLTTDQALALLDRPQ